MLVCQGALGIGPKRLRPPPTDYSDGTEDDAGDGGTEPAEKAQGGDNSSGNQHSTENRQERISEFHAHEESGY